MPVSRSFLIRKVNPMYIKTLNSTYEIDWANKRMRQIESNIVMPAHRAEWRTFVDAINVEVGKQAWFEWPSGKCTITSTVKEIIPSDGVFN